MLSGSGHAVIHLRGTYHNHSSITACIYLLPIDCLHETSGHPQKKDCVSLVQYFTSPVVVRGYIIVLSKYSLTDAE